MFTEHSLLKDKELVKLKVHRAKNTTKKEVLDIHTFTVGISLSRF